ncbi:MAG: BLUF domain-containing protein [Gammaproteobacteria bacterium]|nr:BLUF domain-containing protein [Gammaproteobacteria bacterium]
MFFMIYVSSATQPFSTEQLRDLLSVSRANNTTLNISGMLLYKDGNFMQSLEGEESVVRALYEKISLDNRHKGTLVLLQDNVEVRQFPDWSMGFKNLDNENNESLPGYNELMNYRFTGEEFSANPTQAQKLLLSFKKNMG